jgi:hypothetical protein
MNASQQTGMSEDEKQLLLGEIHAFSVSTVCDKRELFWRSHPVNFKWTRIFWIFFTFFCNALLVRLGLSGKP